MSRSLLIALLTLLVVNTQSLFAQAQTENVLTLQECIQIALENNSTLKTVTLADEAADMTVLNSYSNILPSLDFSARQGKAVIGPAEYLSSEPVGIDSSTGNVIYEQRTRKTEEQSRKQSSADITLRQNIFDGGIWWNQIRKAKVDKKSSEFNLSSQRDNTILHVQTAYFDLITQMKLLEVNDLAVQRSQAQLDRTNKMFELGATARVDVFRAKVNLGNDRISYLNQKNTVVQSRKSLNLVMGRDPFAPLAVETKIMLAQSIPEVEEMVETAFDNQPLMKKGELDIKSAGLSASLARGLYYPRLSAYVNYNRFHENTAQVFSDFDQNYQTQYGFTLSLNLFNGFSDYANTQLAKISKKTAKENYAEYKRNLKATVHQYYADYMNILDIIEINEENLEAANEEMRLEEERYLVGAGTALEVREAQVNLTRAEEILIAAQFSARLTLAQLDTQLGLIYKKLDN